MSDREFIRRKFTITKRLDNELVRLADQYYQGNVSLCIRAAIEDHRETLERAPNNEYSLQKLTRTMEQLREEQTAIQNQIRQFSMDEETAKPVREEIEEEILIVLRDADDGLRIEDIVDRTHLSVAKVTSTVSRLFDYGVLVNDESSDRYFLPGRVNK